MIFLKTVDYSQLNTREIDQAKVEDLEETITFYHETLTLYLFGYPDFSICVLRYGQFGTMGQDELMKAITYMQPPSTDSIPLTTYSVFFPSVL